SSPSAESPHADSATAVATVLTNVPTSSAYRVVSVITADARSEHRVAVGRFSGDRLQHVPVLDDLPVVIEAEDVDARPIAISRPLLVAVQDDVVALGDHSLELHLLAG